jgi:ribokinase
MTMKKVFVVGSTNQDIVVQLDRRPQIGETVFGNTLKYFQGGKGANQAIASHKMGVKTHFISMIGEDAFGRSLKTEMDGINLSSNLFVTKNNPTGVAIISVDNSGDNSIIVIPGSNRDLSIEDVRKGTVDSQSDDILLIQNELHQDMVCKLLEFGKNHKLITILNAAPPVNVIKYVDYIDYLIVNEHELEVSLGVDPLNLNNLEECVLQVEKISSKYKLNLVVTIGDKGLIAYIDGKSHSIRGNKVEVVDTTGAGDCFCGTFASCLARNLDVDSILQYSNYAASISVQELGASSSYPSYYEVIK